MFLLLLPTDQQHSRCPLDWKHSQLSSTVERASPARPPWQQAYRGHVVSAQGEVEGWRRQAAAYRRRRMMLVAALGPAASQLSSSPRTRSPTPPGSNLLDSNPEINQRPLPRFWASWNVLRLDTVNALNSPWLICPEWLRLRKRLIRGNRCKTIPFAKFCTKTQFLWTWNFVVRQSRKQIMVHCKPIPVMKTGFSLCTFSHREKPVSISWNPCWEKVHREIPVLALYWPCKGLQCVLNSTKKRMLG